LYFNKETSLFCPAFDLQNSLLQEKSNDIKIFSVKATLQKNSDVIVPIIAHNVVDTVGDTEDPHHTYVVIVFAQSEKSLYFPY